MSYGNGTGCFEFKNMPFGHATTFGQGELSHCQGFREHMQNQPIKIGAVNYLNTKPLVYGLSERAQNIEISYDLPSRLADDLTSGRLDVALIPSIEFFQDPTYTIISDACIGCRGPVLSVKLFSRVPFDQIGTLALDEGSRTSAALVKILLEQRYGIRPRTEPLSIGSPATTTSTDAVLLIGDRAIHSPSDEFVAVWDLGDQWCRWAELPFVFAMWVGRDGRDWHELAVALSDTRDEGLRHLKQIAEQESQPVGLDRDECLAYLRNNLYFHLGPRELQGLELFYQLSSQIGAAPEGIDLSITTLRS